MPDYRKFFFNLSLNLRRAVLSLTIKLAHYSGNYSLKFIQTIWKLWEDIVIFIIINNDNILEKSSSSMPHPRNHNSKETGFLLISKLYPKTEESWGQII